MDKGARMTEEGALILGIITGVDLAIIILMVLMFTLTTVL
jgi:hypothetical protein